MTIEKPKPKQFLLSIITEANTAMNQSVFLPITCNLLKAREKSRVQDAIDFAWFYFSLVEQLTRDRLVENMAWVSFFKLIKSVVMTNENNFGHNPNDKRFIQKKLTCFTKVSTKSLFTDTRIFYTCSSIETNHGTLLAWKRDTRNVVLAYNLCSPYIWHWGTTPKLNQEYVLNFNAQKCPNAWTFPRFKGWMRL
mgnify:CR=1 FL=1